MKKFLLSGLIAMAAVPTVIWAADQQNLNVTANVTPFCQFNAGITHTSPPNNMALNSTTASQTFYTLQPSFLSGGAVSSASFTLTIPASCNASSVLSIQSINNGLKDTTSPVPILSGAFRNVINYFASAQWGATATFLTTDGDANPATPKVGTPAALIVGPRTDIVSVQFNLSNNGSEIVVAGNYSDTLRITLDPQ